jgi:hypothetical protein
MFTTDFKSGLHVLIILFEFHRFYNDTMYLKVSCLNVKCIQISDYELFYAVSYILLQFI